MGSIVSSENEGPVALPPKNTHHLCACGHIKGIHPKSALHECERCDCAEYRCDHTRCGWKPRTEEPEPSSADQCHCGHIRFRHERDEFDDMHCSHPSCDCTEFAAKGPKTVDLGLPEQPAEPPMTPEEEEQAPEDVSPEEMDRRWAKAMGDDEPPPPQPERRPPLLVAYAVQGHVYEVAVPGDASVHAADGALVVTHHLGPVAGVCRVAPLRSEE